MYSTTSTSGPEVRSGTHDASTRDLVLRAVVQGGPVTAADLAGELSLTPTAVRRHLDSLEDAGRIRQAPAAETRKGPGRPPRAYVAGDAPRPLDPSGLSTAYDDIAAQALRFLAEQAGPDAVAAFARRRIADLEERYGRVVAAAGDDVIARARALAGALAQDGFAATARPVGPMPPLVRLDGESRSAPDREGGHAHVSTYGVQLCQGHCPVQQVAAEFPELCEAETEAFARLLGVHVQRLATLARGGHACTTYVPGAPPGAPPAATPQLDPTNPDERSAR